MQKNQNLLYSSHKQNIWKRWKVELGDPHWVNWESTSELDTDCDAQAVSMTQKLQEHVMELQTLEAAQLPGEAVAEVVMQVVKPVVTMTPVPTDMDMDMTGAMPESMMGPGVPVLSPDMLLVLNTEDQLKQREDEERKQKWAEQAFHHPTDPMDSEDLDDNTAEK